MRVMLLLTSLEVIEESYHDSLNAAYPLGLAYLHSYLEQLGHVVTTLDMSEVAIDECESRALAAADAFAPEVVGLQVLTSTRASALRVARAFNSRPAPPHIVFGGVHSSELYKRILENDPTIIVVRQEGELSFASLLRALSVGSDLAEIPGLAYVRNGSLVDTGRGEIIADLDELPFPRHEVFIGPTTKFASIMTSRGCPFTCSFCSVARRPMRFRSVNNVVDEIEHIHRTFPQVETIRIWDDQFFYKLDRVIRICEEIVRRGIRLKFICLGRLKPISRELVLALERAGFIHVLFGLETGSAKVLENCNKGVRPPDALRAATLFKESRIEISMFLIVGLKGESHETIEETARLVQEIQAIRYFPGWSNVGIATIYPGTDLYDDALSCGWMQPSYWDNEENSAPLYTLEHHRETLELFLDQLLNSVDPLRLISSREGFIRQRHLIPSIVRWVFQNYGRTDNPYRLKGDLAPFVNLVLQVLRKLEQEEVLIIRIGGELAAHIEAGEANIASIVAEPGAPGCYRFELEPLRKDNLLMQFVRQACELGDEKPIFKQLCSGIDSFLAKTHDADAPYQGNDQLDEKKLHAQRA